MSPNYSAGDFVLISKSPAVLNNLSIGDDVVFIHQIYNKLIKRIIAIQPDNFILVKGLNPLSVNSEILGPVHISSIIGKVILHISK